MKIDRHTHTRAHTHTQIHIYPRVYMFQYTITSEHTQTHANARNVVYFEVQRNFLVRFVRACVVFNITQQRSVADRGIMLERMAHSHTHTHANSHKST